MKLNLTLTAQNIQLLKNQVQKMQKQLENEMFIDFLNVCGDWFVAQANTYVEQSGIGSNVKAEIKNGWERNIKGTTITLTNATDKAVFVEFGVGRVGSMMPHVNAQKENYEYEIGSRILSDGSWIFEIDSDENVDVELINNRTTHTVRTFGSRAVMYAFNALQDLKLQMPKLWQQVKAKYWG